MSTKSNEVQIKFCQNCGNEVVDRMKICSCGRLPYYFDNEDVRWNMDEVRKMNMKEFNEFIDKDSDNESEFEINFCKDCGNEYGNGLDDSIVNEETGEVIQKCSCNS